MHQAKRFAIRPWSGTELAFLRANHGSFPAAVIGRELGRSVNAVYRRAQVLGLRSKCFRWTKERQHAFMQHYGAGLNDREVAAIMRCQRKTVSDYRQRLQLPGNGHTASSSRLHSQRMALTASKWGCQSLAQVAKVRWRQKAIAAGLPGSIGSRRQFDVLLAFRKHGDMGRRQVSERTGLAYSYANDVLNSMLKLGLLERHRYTSWRGRPYFYYKLVTQK